MRASLLSVYARSWLEHEGLDHLLPDPFGHEHIKGMIATHYPGGCSRFLKDVDGRFDLREPMPQVANASATSPPLRPRPVGEQLELVSEPTWFNPVPVTKVCARDRCGKEFETEMSHERFCSLTCHEGWRPFDRATVDRELGRAA